MSAFDIIIGLLFVYAFGSRWLRAWRGEAPLRLSLEMLGISLVAGLLLLGSSFPRPFFR